MPSLSSALSALSSSSLLSSSSQYESSFITSQWHIVIILQEAGDQTWETPQSFTIIVFLKHCSVPGTTLAIHKASTHIKVSVDDFPCLMRQDYSTILSLVKGVIRYTSVFMGRLARRAALSSSWQFDCNCPRCQVVMK